MTGRAKMKDNYVAKNMGKFNKAAVHLDRKKESKRKPKPLQQQRDIQDYMDNKKEIKNQQCIPRHNQW